MLALTPPVLAFLDLKDFRILLSEILLLIRFGKSDDFSICNSSKIWQVLFYTYVVDF